ncbi:putative integral membrane protein TerC [Dioscorea sansibarensis]
MGFAPPIHHHPCVQIPLRFAPVIIPRVPSSSISSPSPLHRYASSSSSCPLSVRGRCLGRRLPWILAAGGTKREHQSVTEEVQGSDPQLNEIENAEDSVSSSVRTVAFWVFAAVTFGAALGLKEGAGKASEYFAGYILEQSLSVDNLFVFVLVFKYFQVPKSYQNRVLSYGIAGAIIFRAIIILLGTATLQRFEVVNILLALILLYSSYKLFSSEEEDTDLADNFIVKTCQRFIPVTAFYDGDRFLTVQEGAWKATPLLLTVAVIELTDIAFAVDSIPAVFGVTRDPFIVFSSNLFAISGLRALYILISQKMSDLEYLQPAIGIVLGFIGTKMIFDFFGFHIATEASLGIVAATIGGGVVLSLLKQSD